MAHAPARQRLAAILSADAAGYSRLMAQDEGSTIASLHAARDVFRHAIKTHNGRVVDTAGDSVLAIFETAIGAVSAALEVQAALESSTRATTENCMPFRIGVHLADVLELPDGGVYGDGVNVAARLQALAEPGGIALSDVARSAIKGKLAIHVHDAEEHRVKNIPEPLRVFKVASVTSLQGSAHKVGVAPSWQGRADHVALPDKPSIAVLPFTNMSTDPEQEYFCDGVSDDIITELSRFHSLFVIARNSSFTYKGPATDVRTIAKELGVRYVLEGGVRRIDNRIRVNAQLIDALTGAHLWAEKYDREVTQIFDVQEELTQRIVGTIAPFIEEAERERVRRRPSDVGAYEVGVRAMAKAYEAYRSSDAKLIDEAIAHASTALSIDPSSVISLVAIAFCQWQRLALGGALDANNVWENGISAATRAIEADRHDCMGYVQRAMLLAFAPHVDRRAEALPNAKQAYELNPHNMGALMVLAFVETVAGDTSSAIEHLDEVLRVSPRDPMRYAIYNQCSETYFLAGRYAEGAQFAALGIQDAPMHGVLYGWLALNHAGLGDLPRARTELAEAKRFAPGWVDRGLAGRFILRDQEQRARVTSLLRSVAGHANPVP